MKAKTRPGPAPRGSREDVAAPELIPAAGPQADATEAAAPPEVDNPRSPPNPGPNKAIGRQRPRP